MPFATDNSSSGPCVGLYEPNGCSDFYTRQGKVKVDGLDPAAINVFASIRSLQRLLSKFIGARNGLAVISNAPFPGARV